MPTIWLIVLTIGAMALIAAMYFGMARNKSAPPGDLTRAERGARELREELQRDPEYREE
jgi:hypothetical protein